MSILLQTISDSFTYPDGALPNPPWLSSTNFYSGSGAQQKPLVKGNAFTVTLGIVGVGNSFGLYSQSLSPNQYARIVITGVGANGTDTQLGPVVRATPDGQNGYYVIVGPNTFGGNQYCQELWKLVNGVFTQIGGTFTTQTQIGDVVEIWAIGNRIYGFVNGVMLWSVIDNDLTSGLAGITAQTADGPNSSQATTADNFSAGNILMPNLTTLATDDFNRANETPVSQGGKWTTYGGILNGLLGLVSHTLQNTDSGNDGSIYSGISWPNDQFATLTLPIVEPQNTNGIILARSTQADSHGYWLQIIGDSGFGFVVVKLFMYDGVAHLLGQKSVNTFGVPGDTVSVYASGSQLMVLYNNIVQLFFTDTTFPSGKIGVQIGGGANLFQFSNFVGGQLSTPQTRNSTPPYIV